ncbi:uncharacterized protein BXZ73DRAFT_105175 [Epithele typhae]|uniref:uncharacterized protein n=1 Tax=Epithele typhae TaxID=378194 RepID=UPI002007E9E0|nr:uncharacterized protein BXZ73DRAFT_105175 [Epithele typhae]KAH9918535.1 hypothetical protein BXZ73DRAFT_105175 [Epithele typhae]
MILVDPRTVSDAIAVSVALAFAVALAIAGAFPIAGAFAFAFSDAVMLTFGPFHRLAHPLGHTHSLSHTLMPAFIAGSGCLSPPHNPAPARALSKGHNAAVRL